MLRYSTAGESHGQAIIAIIEGLPSGLEIDPGYINRELSRRRQGYGRGGRMQIEKDTLEILSGVYGGKTIGSPVTLMIRNKDATIEDKPEFFSPRPGHADLAGGMKYDLKNMRYVLERSSARETVGRVAAGTLCKKFLEDFNMTIKSRIVQIGKVGNRTDKGVSESEVVPEIDKAVENKDSLGGVFEVIVRKPVPGLGSYAQRDQRLDGILAGALMSIQAIKGVEIGLGFNYADKAGSEVHDEIFYSEKKGFYRNTNNAGGIEGGMTNGEDIIVRAAMKPIPTLGKPLKTVNVKNKQSCFALKERADVCAVSAAAVVGEASVAFEIARAFREKFGGDAMVDVKKSYEAYIKRIKEF
jgi:chorismate synthase